MLSKEKECAWLYSEGVLLNFCINPSNLFKAEEGRYSESNNPPNVLIRAGIDSLKYMAAVIPAQYSPTPGIR